MQTNPNAGHSPSCLLSTQQDAHHETGTRLSVQSALRHHGGANEINLSWQWQSADGQQSICN
jgi:hypothetical protein